MKVNHSVKPRKSVSKVSRLARGLTRSKPPVVFNLRNETFLQRSVFDIFYDDRSPPKKFIVGPPAFVFRIDEILFRGVSAKSHFPYLMRRKFPKCRVTEILFLFDAGFRTPGFYVL